MSCKHVYMVVLLLAAIIQMVSSCPTLEAPENGTITCLLGDDNQPTDGDVCTYICDDGFKLSGDPTRKCHSRRNKGQWSGSEAVCTESQCQTNPIDADPYLIFITYDDVRRININGTGSQTLVTGLSNAAAIDFHYCNDRIYYTDVGLGTINTAPLSTGYPITTLMSGLGSPDGLAVDWINDKLYWTDARTNTLEQSDLDGNFRRILVYDTDEPRGIALNPMNNTLYMTDWGLYPRIEKMRLDGSGRQTIITQNLKWPNAISIDFTEPALYWADAGTGIVARSDLNGNNIVILLRGSYRPFAVTVFGKYLYWTDWSLSSIERASKHTPNSKHFGITAGLQRPSGMHIVHHSRQEIGVSSSCPTLEAPENGTITCLLGDDNQPTDGDVCTYICDDGFKLRGNSTRRCHSRHNKGQWSGSEAVCKERICRHLSNPNNGAVNCILRSGKIPRPGDFCNFTCDNEYKYGDCSTTRVCQRNGMWSGKDAICERKCPKLHAPNFGTIYCTDGADVDAVPGDTCYFSCNSGYTMNGSPISVCQNSHIWSNAVPICYKEIYVTDLKVIVGENKECESGYEKLMVDLNMGTTKKGKYINLCYRRSTDDPPITAITVIAGEQDNFSGPSGYNKIDNDLNEGAKGDYIYLFYTTAKDHLHPIREVTVDVGKFNYPPTGWERIETDLNKGAGGQYIYIAYLK